MRTGQWNIFLCCVLLSLNAWYVMIQLLLLIKLTFRDTTMLSTERSLLKGFYQVLRQEDSWKFENGNYVTDCNVTKPYYAREKSYRRFFVCVKFACRSYAPYSHADLLKSCMLKVAKTMFLDKKTLEKNFNQSRYFDQHV